MHVAVRKCPHPRCRLWSTHPHVNKDKSKAWIDTIDWYPIYKTLGHSRYLPPDKKAVKVSGNWVLQNLSSSDEAPAQEKKKFKVSDIANTNLLNYLSKESTFNPLISARVTSNGHDLGKGILDSGAFGGYINNYVNQATIDRLLATNSVVKCSCPSTKICTITNA